MPRRRSLVAFAALIVFPLPACLHVGPAATPITPPPQTAKLPAKAAAATPPQLRSQFAALPSIPGTVIQTNPQPTTQTPISPSPLSPTNPVKPASVNPELLPPVAPLPQSPLLAAMEAYTQNRQERANEIIRTMDKHNQDLVREVMPILARGATADLMNDPATTAALVDQMRTAAARLEPRAALKVEKVAFCTDVAGFGKFAARPEANPYRPNEKAHLYIELRNLGDQITGDGGFYTHVQVAVEIRDAHGKLVEQSDPEHWNRRVPVVKYEKREVTRSRRHDFHVLYEFATPAAPGVYTITVQFTDSTGRRTVKSDPREFRVAGP